MYVFYSLTDQFQFVHSKGHGWRSVSDE